MVRRDWRHGGASPRENQELALSHRVDDHGAVDAMSVPRLLPEERRRGVAAASAGNHAQGVAYHAARLSIPATIFMPVGTPMVKIENTRRQNLMKDQLTIARYSRECYVHMDSQLVPSTLIHRNGSVDTDCAIVNEFDCHER